MDILDNLFEVYKASQNEVLYTNSKTPITFLKFGDVIGIKSNITAVYIGNDTAVIMSNFWEFATNTDMFVAFEHPISLKWIIELDKRIFLSNSMFVSFCGSLSQEDIKILKNVLSGGKLPLEKTGPKVLFNSKDPRFKFKAWEVKKVLEFNKNFFYE